MLYSFVIDLNLTSNNEVKILELQQPVLSGSVGYEQAYQKCIMRDVVLPFYKEKFSLPFKAVDPRFSDVFRVMGQGHKLSFADFYKSKKIYKEACQLPTNPNFDKGDLRTYTALISPQYVKHHYSSHVQSDESLEILTDTLRDDICIINDNRFFHSVTQDKFLQSYLLKPLAPEIFPEEVVVPKTNAKEMCDRVLNSISSEKIVLKTPTDARGEGVVVCDRENLESLLNYLMTSSDKLEMAAEQRLTQCFNHNAGCFVPGKWKYHDVIIAQSYESTKLIKKENDGQEYTPTMRVFMSVWKEGETIQSKVHGGYWKFPQKAASAKLEASAMISASPSKISGEKVSESDFQLVNDLLQARLPLAIIQITQKKFSDLIREYINTPSEESFLAIERHRHISRDFSLDGLSNKEIKTFAGLVAKIKFQGLLKKNKGNRKGYQMGFDSTKKYIYSNVADSKLNFLNRHFRRCLKEYDTAFFSNVSNAKETYSF